MIKKLLSASRPKTLPASIGPVAMGLAIAYSHIGEINTLVAILTLLCAMFLQVSTNLINDYYDGVRGIDGEDRIGPTRETATGGLSKETVKKSFITTLLISFIIGIYLMCVGGPTIIAIGLSSILFAFIYTGGPLPLAYYGLGEILAFIFFGPVAVYGTYFLQTNQFHYAPIVMGCAPGLISAAIMAINNLRDIKSDSKTTKITLAILLGEKKARALVLIFVLLSSFVPFVDILYFSKKSTVIITSFTMYLFFKTWKAIAKDFIDEKFNNYLASTGKYLFLYGLVYAITLTLP
ncbi:1,4-dihydroxy-2-naphthoate polyprenyltransferase [Bacteriovorax sp. Seq25_V]|uniref:1,4-dihydroxy-2-naphthoate polyprenyltransferase n=1 Tax=Bacteriovorax sp. Seq25_V TaxID=1201288 RepID=UPI00038A3F14|nr:1,4-dihydroxy-2-naphthoate polyprenyltransferase [Bacteriovorax sp. Seq25_V]EQC44400.1 1,4-dihydroxy-2-naphthoate octaprenyltransferase [Bacteriovorax sp. Seq25_V]